MTKNKRALLENLFSKGKAKPQGGLHIEDGNALDRDSLFAATKYFKDKPVAVIHEGLLRYLNFEEKKTVANNIHALLEKFGGVWITSDITLKRVLSGERQEERDDNRKRVLALSGIDIGANTFENEDDAKKFFEELGFSVERHGFMEVADELVSPARIGLPRDEVENLLKDPVVFVMRLESTS
jgi:O-methyltransferase involved in polyketide biosynthesis